MTSLSLALSFSAIADAQNAIERLHSVFEAEVITETKIQDPTLEVAVKVVNGNFTWDSPPPDAAQKKKGAHRKKDEHVKGSEGKGEQEKAYAVFGLKDVNLEIPKGQLTAIVGKVYSAFIVRVFTASRQKVPWDVVKRLYLRL